MAALLESPPPSAHPGLLPRVLGARLALPVVLLLMALTMGLNEWSQREVEDLRAERARLTEARTNGMHTLQIITNAETAQRGILLTGRENYLGLYDQSLAELPKTLNPTLDYLLQSGGATASAGTELKQLVDQKLGELAIGLELHRKGLREQALDMVGSDIGKEGMDLLRRKLNIAFDAALLKDAEIAAQIRQQVQWWRWTTHLLALVCGLAALAYARLLAADRRAQQQARLRLEAEVQARTADLRELAANLQTVQETERARLSRELHDEMGALLTAAKFELLRLRKAQDPIQMAERLKQATSHLDAMVAIKRRIIEDLRPSSLQHLGLCKALELLCSDVSERLGVPVQTRLDELRLDDEAQITVYRLVQEALTNVQKYALASNVQVSLARRDKLVEVVIEDDGRGFDLASERVARHGLAGMRFRVEALGGQLQLASAPGQGTRVQARLPG